MEDETVTDLIDRDAAREALEAGHSLFPQVRAILKAAPAVRCEECREYGACQLASIGWFCGDFERRRP